MYIINEIVIFSLKVLAPASSWKLIILFTTGGRFVCNDQSSNSGDSSNDDSFVDARKGSKELETAETQSSSFKKVIETSSFIA